jgi:hypothetical protein
MIVEAIVAVAGTVAAAYLWETQIRDRVSVRQVRNRDDEDAEALLDLYQELFPDDGTNYAAEEIMELLDDWSVTGEKRHVVAENIVLVAKYHRQVVGFILCHFYPERRKAIISYFGIDKQVAEARRTAATRLTARLHRILRDRRHRCEYLFFDLQGVETTTAPEEAKERKARPRRFKQSASRLGTPAYTLQFQYVCPKVSLSETSREYPFTLMCIPLKHRLPQPVPRALVMEFLTFIHLDCYGDLYPVSDDRFVPYHEHLIERLKQYELTLPPFVNAA